MPVAHKKVLRGDRRLPHRRAGPGPLPLRLLWPDPGHGPLVRRPALPGLPAATKLEASAPDADRPPAALFLLPGHLHTAGGAARILRGAISGWWFTPRCSRPPARPCACWRRILKLHRERPAGLLRRAAHLGPDAGVSPARPLRDPRWRSEQQRRSLAVVTSRFPRAELEGVVDRFSGQGFQDILRPGRTSQAGSLRRCGGVTGLCTRRPLGDGRQSLRYLAPYVFRVAIGDRRIISCDDGNVTFTYRRVGSNRQRKMTLDAMEFLRVPVPPARPARRVPEGPPLRRF